MNTNMSVDGYMSLLRASDGGNAEEVVNEENGVFISTMLRQYFMTLSVIGAWRNGSELSPKTRSQRPHRVLKIRHAKVLISERCREPACMKRKDQLESKLLQSRKRKLSIDLYECSNKKTAIIALEGNSHKAPQGVEVRLLAEAEVKMDRPQRLDVKDLLARKFWTRWVQKVGLRQSTSRLDSIVDWTRLIAPVEDGRIRMLGPPMQP